MPTVPKKSTPRPPLPRSLVACWACEAMIDYAYVFQDCQHIVCASCAHGSRKERECPACLLNNQGTYNAYTAFGLTTGRSQQVDSIIEHHNKHEVNATRDVLKKNNPNAYAQSMISTQNNTFGSQLAPLLAATANQRKLQISQVDPPKEVGRSLRCWFVCCPCLVLWDALRFSLAISRILAKRMAFVTAFIVAFAAIIGLMDAFISPGLIAAIDESPHEYKPYLGFLFLVMIIAIIFGPWLIARIQRAVDLRIESQFGTN